MGVIDRGRLQFQGPLSDLLARTNTVYDVHVRPPADAVVDELRRQAWVLDVTERAPGRIRVVVADAASAERALPRVVADHRCRLVSFNPATDLETAFLGADQMSAGTHPGETQPRMTLWRLEVARLVRTHRWMILFGSYTLFGALGPLAARYFNEIIERFGEGLTITAPDPRPADGRSSGPSTPWGRGCPARW